MPRPSRFGAFASQSPLSTAAGAIVRRLADVFGDRLAAAIEQPTVRAVHDARVAARRLRTALRTFDGERPGKSRRRAIRAVRRLGRGLGGARDADVHLAVLRTTLGSALPGEQPGIAYAIEVLEARRRHALQRVAQLVTSFEPAAFVPRGDDA